MAVAFGDDLGERYIRVFALVLRVRRQKRAAFVGAGLLTCIMVGALFSHLTHRQVAMAGGVVLGVFSSPLNLTRFVDRCTKRSSRRLRFLKT